MEILKKLLEILSEFLQSRKEKKVEKEEIKRVQVEQQQKTQEHLEKRKHEIVKPKPPTDDNFFND